MSKAYPTRLSYRKAWTDAYLIDPPVPLNLDIELASACNAKCSFCLYGDRDWRDGMEENAWDGKAKRRFMPTDMAIALIDEAVELGIPAIKTNFRGESTLHRDYHEIMAYARRATAGDIRCQCHVFGAHPALHDLIVNTNGNCPEKSINGLMCATKVIVSLDSMDPAIYPKVRVGLKLERALEVIDELVSHRHPDLWVRRVVCKDNETEDFKGAVLARWPSGVRVSQHWALDRNHYKNEAVYEDDPSNWERTFCGYTAQRTVVDSSGRFVACCISWENEVSPPDMVYPKTSIKQYWDSDWRKNLTAELRRNEINNPKCVKCTSFAAYVRPERAALMDAEIVS